MIYSFVGIAKPRAVKTGADIILSSRFDLIKGKRVGLVCNHSAVLTNGTHLADALAKRNDVQLVALFGPEHGIRGDAPDGRTVHDSIDAATGVKVYSLYGHINKPTPEMLKDVDVLLFDIQDVGARFYTFISTMFLCMESAAENNVHFIVLDRPDPINGMTIEGPIRRDSLKSFVGWAPIPIRYGMTIGELAIMANTSGWLKDRETAHLTVVKMEHWSRKDWYDQTRLKWIKPSPNMPSLTTATLYPGFCLLEGTNISEGRGTMHPFEMIGAPWIDGKKFASFLNQQKLRGVKFHPVDFTPKEIPHMASNPKYEGRNCNGIEITITNRRRFESIKAMLTVVWAAMKMYPDSFQFRERGFDRLFGTPVPREMLSTGKTPNEIIDTWKDDIKHFKRERRKALLYLR